MISGKLCSIRAQPAQRVTRTRLPHERLADQECLIANPSQPGDVRAVFNSAFRYAQSAQGNSSIQPNTGFERNLKCPQVAVIHTNYVEACGERSLQLTFIVNLTKNVESQFLCRSSKASEFSIAQ